MPGPSRKPVVSYAPPRLLLPMVLQPAEPEPTGPTESLALNVKIL